MFFGSIQCSNFPFVCYQINFCFESVLRRTKKKNDHAKSRNKEGNVSSADVLSTKKEKIVLLDGDKW